MKEEFGQERQILWVPGFLGTMNGTKAQAVSKWNEKDLKQSFWVYFITYIIKYQCSLFYMIKIS